MIKKGAVILALALLLFLTPMTKMSLTGVAHASTGTTGSGIDCNGYSSSGATNLKNFICTDPQNHNDNGWYIGHDEPSLQFFSTTPGSGNDVQYKLTLPGPDPVPTSTGSQTANFENYVAFWFGMAICDPNSYPIGSCTPDTDGQVSTAGSAFLELQFYPPGWAPFINQISCNSTQWCAALNIDSLECTNGFAHCNSACEEPVNFAFIQKDGVTTGPPGPGAHTSATFTPNTETLFMNPGDNLVVTIKDTSAGLQTTVLDTTTGQSGYMVASAGNGFQNAVAGTASSSTCSTASFTPFTFHPEYSTASQGNVVPWAALFPNVNFAMETGHFELGASGDGDADDAPCFPGPTVAGCLNQVHNGDLDFDGTSYVADWADGSAVHPSSFVLGNPTSYSSASGSYSAAFSSFLFATDVPASESASYGGTTCNTSTGAGCVVPPQNSAGQSVFYPFYSQNSACDWLFGNNIAGQTTNNYGGVAQYGSPNPNFQGTFTSPLHSISTCSSGGGGGTGVPEFGSPTILVAAISLLGIAFLTRKFRASPTLRSPG